MASSAMRAAAVEDGRVRPGERPRPEPGPGEVRVAVRACGICGSDLHLLGAGLFPAGHTPGHEIAGVVDAVGDEVADLAPGTPVAVEPFRTCGTCIECRSGRDPLCRAARLLGVHLPGGLAEHVVAPARRLFPAPEGLAPEVLALAEPLAVAIHGLRRGRLARDQRVLVLGAGSVGLLAVLAARALGAGEVLVTARHPHQAERARALGADRVLAEREAGPDALAGLGRETPIDLVVETVGGQADTLNPAARAVRPGGAVAVLGMWMAPVRLETLPFMLKEVSLVWSYCYHHPEARAGARGAGGGEAAARPGARPDFADAVALLAERPEAAGLVSHRFGLEAVDDAFAAAADREAGAVKVSILP